MSSPGCARQRAGVFVCRVTDFGFTVAPFVLRPFAFCPTVAEKRMSLKIIGKARKVRKPALSPFRTTIGRARTGPSGGICMAPRAGTRGDFFTPE